MQNNCNNKKIVKNSIYLYIRMGIVLFLALFSTRIILNTLGVEDYGIFTVVGGFISLFSFLNGTLSSSINRFYNIEIGKNNIKGIRDIYVSSLLIQFLLAVILIIIVEFIGIWYIEEKLVILNNNVDIIKGVFHLAIISLFFTIITTPYSAAVLAYERMNFYAIISIFDALLKFLIAYYIQYVDNNKLLMYAFLIMLISIINFFLYFVFCRYNFNFLRINSKINMRLLRSMISFSIWSLLNPLGYTGRSHGCNLIINYYWGPIINASYSISTQVASAIDSFSMSISVATRPQLIQRYSSGNYIQVTKLFNISSKILFILILMLCVPLIVNMDYILYLWLGNNIPEYTKEFCSLVLLVKLIDSLNPSVTNLILASGHIKKYMIGSFLFIIGIIPLSIIFFYFELGEAYYLFIIMFVLTCFNQLYSIYVLSSISSIIKFNKYLIQILLPCLFISIVVFIVSFIFYYENSFSMLIQSFLLSIILTAVISYYILLDSEERKSIYNYILVLKKKYKKI